MNELVLQRSVKRLLRDVNLAAPGLGNVGVARSHQPLLDVARRVDV